MRAFWSLKSQLKGVNSDSEVSVTLQRHDNRPYTEYNFTHLRVSTNIAGLWKCGVSESAESLHVFSDVKGEYLGEVVAVCENSLGCESLALELMFDEKNRVRKSAETILLSIESCEGK